MKRTSKILCVTALVFSAFFLMTGCPQPPPAPTVSGVTITPVTPYVAKNANITLQAQVIGTNSPSQDVTWEIRTSDTHVETTIGASTGVLTVHADETKASIVVRATSVFDTGKYKEVNVTIVAQGVTVTSVTINTATVPTDPVPRGSYVDFSASVAGENSPPQAVTWSIVTTGISSGTRIDQYGRLFIAANESNNSLQIRAASALNPSISDTATIQLKAPEGKIITITGIPGVNRQAQVMIADMETVSFSSDSPPEFYLYEMGEIIDGTLTVVLSYWDNEEQKRKGWNGTGNYYVVIAFGEYDIYMYTNNTNITEDQTTWTNNSFKVNIQNDVTSLQFSRFRKAPMPTPASITITGLDSSIDDVRVDFFGSIEAMRGSDRFANAYMYSSNKGYFRLLPGYEPWFENVSGSYIILLNIYDYSVSTNYYYVYTNGQEITPELLADLPKYNITSKDFTIPFNLFREIDTSTLGW